MPKRAYAVRRLVDAHEPWTDAREDDVRRLWMEGRSAAEIAKALGGTTRNAVLGIVHRRGWAKRGVSPLAAQSAGGKISGGGSGPGHAFAPSEQKRSARRILLTPPPKPQPAPVYEGALNLDIMALTLTTCRFVTDATKWGTRYCGVKCADVEPYCEHHRALCWTPSKGPVSLPKAVRKGRDEGW